MKLIILISCIEEEKEPWEYNNIEELLRISDEFGKKGEIEKSLLFAKRAYSIQSENIEIKKQLSRIYATIGGNYIDKLDCREGKRYSLLALDYFEYNDGAYNNLSLCAMAEKNFKDCIEYSLENIRLNKVYHNESPAPFHNIANCYMHIKEYDLSIKNFIEALNRDAPSQKSSYFNNLYSLGRIYFIQGNATNSKKYLDLFKLKYDATTRQELRVEFLVAYQEAGRMLKMIQNREKIGFPKGEEPGVNEDVIGILKKR
jgi:tetratricopeptide (TPR) repeat protein